MRKLLCCIAFLTWFKNVPAQTTIKQFYDIFPHRFVATEAMGSMENADTTIDNTNAYLHIKSKPNDCCKDYITFTYFKTQAGEKVFGYEVGASTTASDDFKTNFYSCTNKKWLRVTPKVFPYQFSFADFWRGKSLPPKKLQKFKIHIELPSKGTIVYVHIFSADMMNIDDYFPKKNDADDYEKLFRNSGLFYKLAFEWDKQKGIFRLKEKLPKKDEHEGL
jgi:hypothetical protein